MATMLQAMIKPKKKKVEVMDTELRTNVPVKQVKKETQSFVDAMEDARKKTAAEIANKRKFGSNNEQLVEKITEGPRRTKLVLIKKKD
jgi:hypothetical protein